MSDVKQSHLDSFPEGAIEVAQGRIQGLNQAARDHFPELAVGMETPAFLSGSLDSPEGAGTFRHNGTLYLFSRVTGEERELVLFRPAPQSALTQRQLDGFVRQMRGFLQEILLEFEAMSAPGHDGMEAFGKSFCRVYRLLSNLDFLRAMDSPEGVPFQPSTVELVGLCSRLSQEASFLLREAEIKLSFRCGLSTLLIPGDAALLQKLLLTLLSNAAKAAGRGEVILSLTSHRGRAVITLSDTGGDAWEKGLDALFPQEPAKPERIPGAQEGAGMGLAIARHIAALHKGTLLLEPRKQGLFAAVSLPTAPLNPRMAVQTPRMEETSGLSPVLVELADVLPLSLFHLEDEE